MSEHRREVSTRIKAAWRREGASSSASGRPNAGVTLELTGLTPGSLPTLVADLSHVHELKLARMAINEADLAGFLPVFEGVVELDLGENQLTTIAPELAVCKGLRELALDHNQLQWHNGLFAPLEGLPLRELDLGDNPLQLSGAGMKALARIKRLQRFSMQNAALTLEAGDIAELAKLKRLQLLDLNHNQISLLPESAAAFAKLTALRQLRLSNNPLGRSPHLASLSLLEHLEMNHAQLSEWPAGLSQLMAQQPGSLRQVMLVGNPIADVPPMVGTPFANAARAPGISPLLLSAEHLTVQSRMHLSDIACEPVEPASDALWMRGASRELNRRLELLQADSDSANFLLALERSTLTADYRTNPERQRRLMWQLLEDLTPEPPQPGMTDLRQQLYQAADDAEGTCGDGLQLVFNHARNMVEVYKVLLTADIAEPATVMPAVVFGKRLFRLDLVDECAMRITRRRSARRAIIYPDAAQADAAGGVHRPTLTEDPNLLESTDAWLDPLDNIADADLQDAPDEAEIRLKLRLMLVDSLDLPNVPRNMLYVAHVEESTARQVGEQVKRETTAAGMLEWLVRQAWWKFLLERTWPAQLGVFEERWNEGYSALFELSRHAPEPISVSPQVLQVFKASLPHKAWDSPDLANCSATGPVRVGPRQWRTGQRPGIRPV